MPEEELPYVYEPELAAKYWDQIGPFVTGCVRSASTASRYSEEALFAAATPLTLWAWQRAMPLDPTVIFDRDVIDRFINTVPQYRTKGSRATMRSRLLRISEALVEPDAIVTALYPLGKSDPSAPYSDADVTALRSWASVQPTRERRASALALLALGIGAGLYGREIIACQLSDIEVDGLGVLITVQGEHARRVALTRNWEDELVQAIELRGGEGWAFRDGQGGSNANLITDFVSRSSGKVALQARRMRATWIVHHLDAGTPTLALLNAAGVQTLEAFDRFIRFARPPEPAVLRASVRGDRRARQ